MTILPARLIAAAALVAGAMVLLAPRPAAIAGGLLLAFVLPGLALIGLLRRRTLTPVETTVLAPGLSMGVVIVAGLVIHLLGPRIDRLAWTVSTVGVTMVALAAAQLLPRRTPARNGTAPPPRRGVEQPPVDKPTVVLPSSATANASTVVMSIVPVAEDGPRTVAHDSARRRRLLRQFLPLVLVAALLGGASWLSFQTSRDTHDTVVTALSAAPSGPVDAAGNRTVQMFATGLRAADGPYTISVTGPAGTATLRRTVTVPADGTWYEVLSLPGAQRLTVSLFRSGDTTAYRTLYVSAVD